MKVEDVKYLFTITGGGWGYTHDLYVVTKDDKIYYTEKFNNKDLLDCEPDFMCDLYPKNLKNSCISSSISWDENKNRIVKRKYLFDLLNKDGKVDFEDFMLSKYACMDGVDITLYKNVNNKLQRLVSQDYDSDGMPAIRYVIALRSKARGGFI